MEAFRLSGRRNVGGVVLLRWLCESLTKFSQFRELLSAELRKPLRHVLHGFAEPFDLMLRRRFDYTAPHDVLKELVPRFLERRRDRWGPTSVLLFGHVPIMRVRCRDKCSVACPGPTDVPVTQIVEGRDVTRLRSKSSARARGTMQAANVQKSFRTNSLRVINLQPLRVSSTTRSACGIRAIRLQHEIDQGLGRFLWD